MNGVEKETFLGTGWGFPVLISTGGKVLFSTRGKNLFSTGDKVLFSTGGKELLTYSGSENVHKSVYIILNTRVGERIMHEDFGAGLQNLHFEPINARLINGLKKNIQNTLLLHEPRIIVDDIVVSMQNPHEGVLLIDLHYTLKNTNSRFNMVFPFYVETKT